MMVRLPRFQNCEGLEKSTTSAKIKFGEIFQYWQKLLAYRS